MVWVCRDVPATNVARLLQTAVCLLQTAICLLQTAVCLLQAQMLKKYTAWSPCFRKHFKLLESVQTHEVITKRRSHAKMSFRQLKTPLTKSWKNWYMEIWGIWFFQHESGEFYFGPIFASFEYFLLKISLKNRYDFSPSQNSKSGEFSGTPQTPFQ